MTEDEILEKDPLKLFRQLVKLRGVNGDDEKDEEVDAHVSRRKTVMGLAKNKEKKKAVINDLDSAFATRMAKLRRGEESKFSNIFLSQLVQYECYSGHSCSKKNRCGHPT